MRLGDFVEISRKPAFIPLATFTCVDPKVVLSELKTGVSGEPAALIVKRRLAGVGAKQAGAAVVELPRLPRSKVSFLFNFFPLSAFLALILCLAAPGSATAQLHPGGERDSSGPISISSDFLEADDINGLVTFTGQVVARQGTMTITSDVMKIYYVKVDDAGSSRGPVKAEATVSGDEATPLVPPLPPDLGAIPGNDAATAMPSEENTPAARPSEVAAVAQEAAAAASSGSIRPDGGGSQIERVECDGNVKIVDGDRLAIGQHAVYLVKSLPRRIVLTGDARLWQGRDSLTGHQVTYYLDAGRSTVESQGQGQGREKIQTIYHQEEQKK